MIFKSISNLWQVARGTELFKKVNKIARTLPTLQGEAGARCMATILSAASLQRYERLPTSPR
jgi:hypothetical protein